LGFHHAGHRGVHLSGREELQQLTGRVATLATATSAPRLLSSRLIRVSCRNGRDYFLKGNCGAVFGLPRRFAAHRDGEANDYSKLEIK
jgi:hypothetical protein